MTEQCRWLHLGARLQQGRRVRTINVLCALDEALTAWLDLLSLG